MKWYEEDPSVVEKFLLSIYKYLGNTEDDYRYKIHVSDLIYDCTRRAYYNKIYPTIVDIAGALRMSIGKAVHEIQMSPGHEMEIEFEGILGHIDEYWDGIVVDKKTCRMIPREPYSHHVKQVEMYRAMLLERGYEVERLAILYIDVSKPEIKAYSWEPQFDPLDVLDEMLTKKAVLLDALKSGIAPPRHVSWECNYCPYAWQCFKEVGDVDDSSD